MRTLCILIILCGLTSAVSADFGYQFTADGTPIRCWTTPRQTTLWVNSQPYTDLTNLITYKALGVQYQPRARRLYVEHCMRHASWSDEVSVTVYQGHGPTLAGQLVQVGKRSVIRTPTDYKTYTFTYRLCTKHHTYEIRQEAASTSVPRLFAEAVRTLKEVPHGKTNSAAGRAADRKSGSAR